MKSYFKRNTFIQIVVVGYLISLSACKLVRPEEPDFNSKAPIIDPVDTLMQIVDSRVLIPVVGNKANEPIDIYFDDQILVDTFPGFSFRRTQASSALTTYITTVREARNFWKTPNGARCRGYGFLQNSNKPERLDFDDKLQPKRDSFATNTVICPRCEQKDSTYLLGGFWQSPYITYNGLSIASKYRGKTVKLTLRRSSGAKSNTLGEILYEDDFTFPSAGPIKLHIKNTDTPDKLEIIPDSYERVLPTDLKGKFKMKVLNLTYENTASKTLSISLSNGKKLFTDLGLGTSPYIELPFGTYTFIVTDQDSDSISRYSVTKPGTLGNILVESKYHTFTGKAGGIYTLVVSDSRISPSTGVGTQASITRAPATFEVEWRNETNFESGFQVPNYGKIQILNAHPDYLGVTAKINEVVFENTAYGNNSEWELISAGDITLSFNDQNGNQIISESFPMPANAQLIASLVPNQTDGAPKIVYANYPEAPISAFEPTISSQGLVFSSNVCIRFLHLSPDAGRISLSTLTEDFLQGINIFGDIPAYSGISYGQNLKNAPYFILGNYGITGEATINGNRFFPILLPSAILSPSVPPTRFIIRAATAFPAVQGEPLGIELNNPFVYPSKPGLYTIACIGYLKNNNDANRRAKLVLLDHNK